MKSYRDFNTVEELKEYYHIQNRDIIVEKKVDIPQNEEDPGRVVNPDKLNVVYSDLNADPTNIFKHIVVFTNDRDSKSNKTLKNIEDAIKTLKSSKSEIVPELHVFIAADITISDDESKI